MRTLIIVLLSRRLTCKTVFDYSLKITKNKKFKCSVCNHIWMRKESDNNIDPEKTNLKNLLLLNIIIFLSVVFAFFIFRDYLENTDPYWQNIYLFFDNLIPIQ